MVNVNQFRPGITFADGKDIFIVIESSHSKQGRGQANVKAKVKNLRTGSTTMMTYTGGEKVKKARIDSPKMQYLYNDGEGYIFMDQNTYEQVTVPNEKLD
jgi:elongation factor P